MTLRSPDRGKYLNRLAIVLLLALNVYAFVAAETGGNAFKVWRPDRMRLVLIALIVVGAAAYELRPREGVSVKTDGQGGGIQKEPDAEAAVPAEGAAAPEVDCDERVSPVVSAASSGAARLTVAEHVARAPEPESAVDGAKKSADGTSSAGATDLTADEAWSRARVMVHEFVPDEVADAEYLELVRRAAALGHTLAMVKLGDYAFRRGWIVEAYYWTLLAQLKGAPDLDVALAEIRKVWRREGYPPEYENVRPDFSEQQGVFARAVLRLKCGQNAAVAKKRLYELRDAQCSEALLYLARTGNPCA